MDPKKIQVIVEWLTLENAKDVLLFLGFANFYRKFILKYSEIASPFTNLTQKDVQFLWNREAEDAFQELKQRFQEEPILKIFDPELPIVVETDASDRAIGAVLNQIHEDRKLYPVAFHSQKFSPVELNYGIADKELLAIIDVFKQ